MNVSPNNSVALAFQRWSKVASVFLILEGALVLFGWFTRNPALESLLPGSVVMKANTALCFQLAGLALWLVDSKSSAPWLPTLRRASSSVIVLVGLLTLGEYLFGWKLGIDELLVRETLSYGGVLPGRMAPLTAFNFVLLGASLLHLGEFKRVQAAQILALPVLLSSLVAAVGYLYGEQSLYQVGAYTPIALPSALAFLVACAGILLMRPSQGWVAIFTSEHSAGVVGRRLLPAVILVPIVLGWLRLVVETRGHYNPQFVAAVAAVINAIIYGSLVAWSVRRLHEMSLARQWTGDELQRLYKELEGRVLERTAELVQANELVEQERDQLQSLMDGIPDTIYFKDRESRFTRINQAQARTLGLEDPQQAIGKTDADFFLAEAAAAAFAAEQHIIHSGEPSIDLRELNPMRDGQPRWFSSTKVPVLDQHGKVTGLVGVSRDITNRIKEEQILAEEKAQLSDRLNQMAVVIELDEQLQACVSDQEVYQVTARLIGRLFPGELGALYFISPDQQSVETAITWGTPPLPGQTFELDDCWALRRGKPHYSGGDRAGEVCPHLAGSQPAYSLCVPLSAAGERLGILHLRTAPGGEMHDSSDVQKQSAQLAADSLALAWANVRLRESLHEQAVRDPLTGLFNRRHMQESLERELRRAARNDKPIGIIMLDIDHFKEVNDLHGHDAGDVVLRELGRFLKEHTRGGDIACRLGGEEFIIILPEANLEQTRGRAEKHLQAFSALHIECNGSRIDTPTLSIGVAAFPRHGTTTEELFRAVDAALYRAKEAGRNRVVAAG